MREDDEVTIKIQQFNSRHYSVFVETTCMAPPCTERYPDIGLQISYNSGRSWQWYIVDTSAFEANGNFIEARPDVALFFLHQLDAKHAFCHQL
jgi:hypothetical protein